MSQMYVSMAVSLDGYITGPHDDAQNPAGINGMRLMDWLGGGGSDASGVDAFRPHDPNSQIVFDEGLATGAVITGKRTGDFAGYWDGDHRNGVPIFVPTHRHPPRTRSSRSTTSPMASPPAWSRPKQPLATRRLHAPRLRRPAGPRGQVLDAIEIQLRPVLLGQGRRLFDDLPPEHIELDLVRALQAPATLHLRYEVRHA